MKILKVLGIGFAALVAIALLWLFGGPVLARSREEKAERAWVQSFGPLQQLVERYPKTATNETAHRLEVVVRPIGLDFSPRDPEKVFHSESSESADSESWQALFDYLTSQLQRPEATIDPPPQHVRSFLTAHAGDLLAVQETLLTLPPPVWSFDPASLPVHQTIPSIRDLIRLQRVLLAETLVQSGSEDAAAVRTLEASWKLNQSLRDAPDLASQLLALAVARMQVGTLRKVEVDTSVWRPRLAEHDYKRSVFDTQLLDLWPSPARYRQLEEIEYRSEKSTLKRMKIKFEEPYANMVWSEAREKMRLAYLRIKDSPVMAKEVWDETHGPEKDASDILVAIQMPNLVDCFKRVDRLVIESELTDKVLQARQLRRENNLSWPSSVPGVEATRFPEAKWIYFVSPEGTMTLSLSKEPKWNASGLVLPLRFSSS